MCKKRVVVSLFLILFFAVSSSIGYASMIKQSVKEESIKNQKSEENEGSRKKEMRSKLARKCIGVITALGAVYFLDRAFKHPLLKIKLELEDHDSFWPGIFFSEKYFGVTLGSGVKDLCVGVLCLYCSIRNFKA